MSLLCLQLSSLYNAAKVWILLDLFLYGHQEIAADEENVRKASSYLLDVVLPKFIQDLCTLEVSPMDGQTLTEALHAHGINIRYIGKVSLCVICRLLFDSFAILALEYKSQ